MAWASAQITLTVPNKPKKGKCNGREENVFYNHADYYP